MSIFIAPVASTLPDLAGTGIAVMPWVYDGGETHLTPAWSRRVRDTDHAGKRMTFDFASAFAVAHALHDAGVKHAVYDWEPHDGYGGNSDANIATLVKTRVVFKALGIDLDVWGLGSDGGEDAVSLKLAAASRWMQPGWYPYTKDVKAWEAARTDQLLRLRKNHQLPVCCWISPQASGLPGDYPAGQLVPLEDFDRMCWWAVRYCNHLGVWVNYGDGITVGPWRDEPWLDVLKKYAKKSA